MLLASNLEGQRVLMYAARTESNRGYFGTATIGDLIPNWDDGKFFWLVLEERVDFDRPITPLDLNNLGIAGEMPQTYSKPIRQVNESHLRGLITLSKLPLGFGDSVTHFQPAPGYEMARHNVRSQAVRFQMLEAYGPKCAFSGEIYSSLNGRRFGVDQGHLRPLYADGPDIIQNVLPMSKDVNWHWDEGIFSLTNGGTILAAKDASPSGPAPAGRSPKGRLPSGSSTLAGRTYLEFHRDVVFQKGRMDRQFPG